MKLYTEEQAKYFFECGRNYQNNAEITFRVARDEVPTKPIELPSDNKIKHEAINQMEQWYGSGCEEEIFAFINGAKYVINKIQGGNK